MTGEEILIQLVFIDALMRLNPGFTSIAQFADATNATFDDAKKFLTKGKNAEYVLDERTLHKADVIEVRNLYMSLKQIQLQQAIAAAND